MDLRILPGLLIYLISYKFVIETKWENLQQMDEILSNDHATKFSSINHNMLSYSIIRGRDSAQDITQIWAKLRNLNA